MTRILLCTGALLAILWVVGPDLTSAAHRNLAYLQVLRGHVGPDTPGADDLLTLRRALARGDWMTTERMLARTSYPDRLAALLVIHEAGRRADAGDLAGARAALAAVRAQAADEPVVWYRLGEAYERAHSAEDALQAYAHGAAVDRTAPWTEGRYRKAMIFQRQQQWQAVVNELAPVLETATDADIARTVRYLQLGGAIWQEAFLTLGEAYEGLGRVADAGATYERMARIVEPRRDWTLNRGLVYLARAKRSHADYEAAADAVGRALDLAATFDASFRQEYELDTAAEAERLVDQASRDGQLRRVQTAAEGLVARGPQSLGAWFLTGLVAEAACDREGARSAYVRAAREARPGAGAFLTGRPAEPARWPCPPR
jgi:tetratricopeptide (TPR) repeat protein